MSGADNSNIDGVLGSAIAPYPTHQHAAGRPGRGTFAGVARDSTNDRAFAGITGDSTDDRSFLICARHIPGSD